MIIPRKSCPVLLVNLYWVLFVSMPGGFRAQAAKPDPSNFTVRVVTNPLDEPGGLTSQDSVAVSLTDCNGGKATLDLRSADSNIPGTTARQFQVNPESDDPPDADPEAAPTTRMIEVHHPARCQYVLRITGYRHGAFGLQLHGQATAQDNAFVSLDAIPVYPESRFALTLLYDAQPFTFEAAGALQPANAAFSFAQPSTANVQLPAEEKSLGVVIFYSQSLDSATFRALLDGNDQGRRFHPRPGQQELVVLPLAPGAHDLIVRGNKRDSLPAQQDFHIQRR